MTKTCNYSKKTVKWYYNKNTKINSTEAFHNGNGQGKYVFKEAEEKIEE